MNVVTRPRSPALAPFIEALGYTKAALPHAKERSLPSGHMQLLVNLHTDRLVTFRGADLSIEQRIGGAGLVGAQTEPVGLDTADQRSIIWVCFKPGGALPFFPAPPQAIAGELVGLEELWGRAAAGFRERLLAAPGPVAALRIVEAELLARAVRPLERDPAVRYAVAALERGAAVGEVTERLGLPARRFGSRFAEAVGLRPKRFGRVRRFQRLLGRLAPSPEPNWAALAVECGYFDQAHLINEFRTFSGLSPTRYRARPDGPNHVPLPD
jgi:AraC-like DNA-binding protein